jgi:hypothetical protein
VRIFFGELAQMYVGLSLYFFLPPLGLGMDVGVLLVSIASTQIVREVAYVESITSGRFFVTPYALSTCCL